MDTRYEAEMLHIANEARSVERTVVVVVAVVVVVVVVVAVVSTLECVKNNIMRSWNTIS